MPIKFDQNTPHAKVPFTRERSRSVPSSFQFLERKSRLFTLERNDSISFFISVHTGMESFRSTVFSSILVIFQATTTSTHVLRAKLITSRFWTSLPPHCLFTWYGTKRLRNVTLLYQIFIVPLFGTVRCYFKLSRVKV